MLKLIKFILILAFLSKFLISDKQLMTILLEHLSVSTSQWGFLATRQVNHNAVLSATHGHEILIVALSRHSVDINCRIVLLLQNWESWTSVRLIYSSGFLTTEVSALECMQVILSDIPHGVPMSYPIAAWACMYIADLCFCWPIQSSLDYIKPYRQTLMHHPTACISILTIFEV